MHKGLQRQAHLLVEVDARKPSQANLRRSLSAAYYCLFHALIDDAVRQVAGNQGTRATLRRSLARCFAHSHMLHACRHVASGRPLSSTGTPMPTDRLREVARLFLELQEKRHDADYDIGASFTRGEVRALLTRLDAVLRAWSQIRKDDEGAWFLAALLVGDRVLKH